MVAMSKCSANENNETQRDEFVHLSLSVPQLYILIVLSQVFPPVYDSNVGMISDSNCDTLNVDDIGNSPFILSFLLRAPEISIQKSIDQSDTND